MTFLYYFLVPKNVFLVQPTNFRYLLLNEEAEDKLNRETPLDYKLLRITVFKVNLLSKDTSKYVLGEKVLNLMSLLSDDEQPGKWAGNRKGRD